MQSESLKTIILTVAVLGVAIGGIYYFEKRKDVLAPGGNASTTTIQIGDTFVQGSGNFTIEQVDPNAPVPPSLERTTVFNADLSADARRVLTANITTLKAAISRNSADLGSWMDLGVQYKIAGDYEGARLAWEYVKAAAPLDWTAPYNLGVLYHNYLKDTKQAEANYFLAIKNKSDYTDAYRSLYELYRYSYAAKALEAPKVLERGIAATPKIPDLTVLLAAYYKETGNKSAAITQYQKAKTLAETAGNTALAAALQQEIDALQ